MVANNQQKWLLILDFVKTVTETKDLGNTAFRLLIYMSGRLSDKEWRELPVKTITEHTGIKNVSLPMSELVERGYIERRRAPDFPAPVVYRMPWGGVYRP